MRTEFVSSDMVEKEMSDIETGKKMRSSSIFNKVDNYMAADMVRAQGVYPYFREIISEQDTEVLLKGGKKVLMLGSNSYLGLTNHEEVKRASIEAIEKYGSGCAGSRFLNGTLDIHQILEKELAEFVGMEDALLYSTGFQVNQGVISALISRHDYVILDSYNHASIIDGARLSRGIVCKYQHNSIEDLERVLEKIPAEKGKLIVTDGVFSMEGDVANLPGIVELAEKYSASVMVDDAHGIGVMGKRGEGTSAHFGLTDKVDLIMGTFSKSLASIGGFIASDSKTIDYLKHHSRALIFSASMAPSSAASALAALRLMKKEPERLEQLWYNTELMRSGLDELGFDTGDSETPVIPVMVGDFEKVFVMCKRLEDEGIFINPVVPPAVPPTGSLIRISLMANHTEQQIKFALSKMEKVGRELGVI